MSAVVQCPRTLAVHFPSTVYRSAGSAQVLPDLAKSLDIANVQCIQLVPNGIGFGYVLQDCTGDPVYFDFGRFSRSIQIESTTFEYDRFVKYVHHNVERPYLWSCRTPRTKELPAGTPLEFPKSSK